MHSLTEPNGLVLGKNMARMKAPEKKEVAVTDCRDADKRQHIPPAGLAAHGKLANALKGTVDEECFAALSGTVSLPFPVGKHKRAAVKVVGPRGNETMRVHRLEKGGY